MATYITPSGPTQLPVEAEIWTSSGERLGYLGQFEEMTFTWADRAPDTASLTLPLNDVSSLLTSVDGQALIGARTGGKTHLSVPVEVVVESVEGAPGQGQVRVTTSGGYGLFSGARIPPSLEDPLVQQTGEKYTLVGPLEAVVKRLITLAATRLSLPMYVAPTQNRGPEVHHTGAWETVGEVLDVILARSGHVLEVTSWLPGDPVPSWAPSAPTRPSVFVDMVPYRSKPGLVWSVEGGDLLSWRVKATRAVTTRVTVGYETDDLAQRTYREYSRESGLGAWARREAYVSYEYERPEWLDTDATPDPYRVEEGMEAAGDRALTEGASTLTVDTEVEVSNLWEFTSNRTTPRGFDVGDMAQVSLPFLGTVERSITSVEVNVTPTDFTVVPTVSTPDTLDRDMFSTIAAVERRVSNLER